MKKALHLDDQVKIDHMKSSAGRDLKWIENREWHLWSLTLFLLMAFGGFAVAIYFFILEDVYPDPGMMRSLTYRALGGLLILITLFCLYALHTRLTITRLRGLLVDISSMVTSITEPNVLISLFASSIAHASSFNLCQIAILTQSGLALKLKSVHAVRKGDWKPQVGKTYPLGKVPVCRQVIETLQPIVLHQRDITSMQADQDDLELLTAGLKDIRGVLVIPLVAKGQRVGIIILGEVRGFKRSHLTSSNIMLVQALAKQAAAAIDHARLIEVMQNTSDSLLQSMLESTVDGILVVDRTGKIVSFNQQFVRMWMIPGAILETRDNDQVLACALDQLKQPEQFLHDVKDLYANPEAQSYNTLEFKDGRIFEAFSQPQCIDGQVVGRVWSYRDVTEQKRIEVDLKKQAIHDSLTNLYNRRYFNHRMKEEIARASRNKYSLAILLCDLDHFKSINDAHGHQAGDEVLKIVAESIKGCTRETDLVFRWGGDEIVVILPHSTREGLLIAAERIRRDVRNVCEKAHLGLDLSIGVALYPEHGATVDDLVKLADRALYIAKKGGSKIHIGEEEYCLDEHSIKVVFQPVVDIRSKQVLGYEALSRDTQGKLSILELFDRYQAVGRLNELKRFCFMLQLRLGQQAGLKRIFINVDFNLLSQLEPAPLSQDKEMILEISELDALKDIKKLLEITRRWRAQGYKFAIDDFGAGFISLPFIAQLLPEYIKVDRSTILHAASSWKFRNFLRDLVMTMRNYAKEGIIAEGIENEKELQVVKDLGIDIAQGFLLGKPKPYKADTGGFHGL